MTKFKYKNILITGGASGIGRLMGMKMAKKGGTIVIWDINSELLDKTAEEIRSLGGKVIACNCDITDKDLVYKTAQEVKMEIGNIDILINNAGVVTGKPFWECTDDEIQTTMDVNTMSLFWTTKAFLPDMIKANSGHIITMSSAAGIVGATRLTDYNASKFAAFGFDESLRMEFKKRKMNIKTTVVCPFFINTGMFDGAKTRFPWLLPILNEETVANKIVKAIEQNKARLLMPGIVYTSWVLRYLPVDVFDWLASTLGVSSSMDDFKGRKKNNLT